MRNLMFVLMAFLIGCRVMAQEVVINGCVVDAVDGSPLIGVNVNTESMPMADNRGSMLVITVSGTAVVID